MRRIWLQRRASGTCARDGGAITRFLVA
uniref:Uncharacterized protein n=1 Tax=Rhizophora mucronata TaxID=61149 RepID=A0A2P2PDT5_RHIMU